MGTYWIPLGAGGGCVRANGRGFGLSRPRGSGGHAAICTTRSDSTSDARVAGHVLDLAAIVPVPVWGRDELDAGEMWNSNSVIAWLVTAAGLPAGELRPPAGGRAPGWDAGLAVARRIGCGPPRSLPRARPPRRSPAVR